MCRCVSLRIKEFSDEVFLSSFVNYYPTVNGV